MDVFQKIRLQSIIGVGGIDNADLNRDDFVTNRQLYSVLGTNVLTEYHRMRAEDKSSSKLNKEWRQEC
jgi:hypothetical protein